MKCAIAMTQERFLLVYRNTAKNEIIHTRLRDGESARDHMVSNKKIDYIDKTRIIKVMIRRKTFNTITIHTPLTKTCEDVQSIVQFQSKTSERKMLNPSM